VSLIRRKLRMDRVVKRFALTADLMIERFGGGAYVDGRWVNEQPTQVALTANVQPAGGRQLMRLPEGDRTRDNITVWSTSELRPVARAQGKPGDLVLWNGERYEVIQLNDWSANGDYWEATCAKVDQ